MAGTPFVTPLRAHGQGILADRNRDPERRAQGQTDRLDGGIERSVFPRLAARGHPVGRQLDARELNRRRQQIGEGLGHCHAPGRRRVGAGQRRALAHAHGLAGKAPEVSQGHGAVGHRHLPGTHHLVAVRQTAHAAVANRDQETLGANRRAGQDIDAGLPQIDAAQIKRRKAALHAAHVALHAGRLAQQHVDWHVDGGPHACHFVHCAAPRGGCFALGRPGGETGRHQACLLIGHHQIPLLGGDADDGERTALAFAQGLEHGQRLGRDRQHIALLALVAPDFLGRHA